MKFLIVIIMLAFIVPAAAKGSNKTGHGNKKDVVKDSAASARVNGIDSVNIREMVLQQIEAARKNTPVTAKHPVLQVDMTKKAEPAKTGTGILEKLRKYIPLSGDALTKVLMISGFSLFVFGIIIIRRLFLRKIYSRKGKKIKDLKKNISLIRDERPVKIKDKNKLRSIRSKLIKNYSAKNLTEEDLSKTARELKIAEGELMLAERIKTHGMAGSYESKK